MNTFGLNIVASDKDFYHGRGTSIMLPAKDGQISILAHHADMMVAIVPVLSLLTVKSGRQRLWETGLRRSSITV